MIDQPLQAFAPPAFFSSLPEGISNGTLIVWGLYAVFAFWAIYTLVAIYHWLKYSNASWAAFPAIALHLGVSFALATYILSGQGGVLAPYLP